MRSVSGYLPKGLIGQFMLVLAAALVVANIVAVGLLAVERLQSNRAATEAREIERVVSLLPAVEAVNDLARQRIAEQASTRFSRVSVDPAPVVGSPPNTPRSRAFAAALADAMPDRDVRGAIIGRSGEVGSEVRSMRDTVAISVRIANDREHWLNVITRDGPPRVPGLEDGVFLFVLGLSLVSVLGVGWLFLRRLTRPLVALTAATRAAGAGDRSVRMPVEGSREMQDLARAFNDMQARIARFDAERMRTLGAVGHDLRTPITSLRIRAEMLDGEDAAPMIRTLDEMTVMAEGLVSYARGAGDAEETRRVNLAQLVTELAEERGGEIIAAEDVAVECRPVALKRAIGNLIDNALRYGNAARIKVQNLRDQAVVTIEDDGAGIPQERLDAMFEPFVRGEDSRSDETGGAGLGLAIARNIVISHGGRIALENTGSGLMATVELPRSGRWDSAANAV